LSSRSTKKEINKLKIEAIKKKKKSHLFVFFFFDKPCKTYHFPSFSPTLLDHWYKKNSKILQLCFCSKTFFKDTSKKKGGTVNLSGRGGRSGGLGGGRSVAEEADPHMAVLFVGRHLAIRWLRGQICATLMTNGGAGTFGSVIFSRSSMFSDGATLLIRFLSGFSPSGSPSISIFIASFGEESPARFAICLESEMFLVMWRSDGTMSAWTLKATNVM